MKANAGDGGFVQIIERLGGKPDFSDLHYVYEIILRSTASKKPAAIKEIVDRGWATNDELEVIP